MENQHKPTSKLHVCCGSDSLHLGATTCLILTSCCHWAKALCIQSFTEVAISCCLSLLHAQTAGRVSTRTLQQLLTQLIASLAESVQSSLRAVHTCQPVSDALILDLPDA